MTKRKGWKGERQRHSLATRGIKSKKPIKLMQDTGMGMSYVQLKQENNKIYYRHGDNKHWKESKFKTILEAITYLNREGYTTEEKFEQSKNIINEQDAEDEKINKKISSLKLEIRELENKIPNGDIRNFTTTDRILWEKLSLDLKEWVGKSIRKHDDRIKRRDSIRQIK